MGKIFYVMGKSSTGKDTIFEELLKRKELDLHTILLYTTRPIRAKETNGVQYYFVDDETLDEMERQGKVIELRAYHTVHGIWKYATVDDEKTDLTSRDYLAIGTLESYEKLKEYYGPERILPIYIEVADEIRLERAFKRERKQKEPKYEEMCRRFLSDSADFSEENLKKAGIKRRFLNNDDRRVCIGEIAQFILSNKS